MVAQKIINRILGDKKTKNNELPIYKIKGKEYYLDKRLGEYRNVKNPHDRKDSDDIKLSDLE